MDMIELLRERIKSCHEQLMSARQVRDFPKEYIEGFRCRLDELLLLWHLHHDISFIESCKDLGIKYVDVNIDINPDNGVKLK